MRRLFIFSIISAFLFAALSCDRGLEPPSPDTKATISGRVHFSGRFPPCDSSRILAVVLVETPPPYTPAQIVTGLYTTVIPYVLDACTFHDTTYTFTLPPKKYHYLGVAQNYDTNLSTDWRVVGFIHTANDSARIFDLKGGEVYSDIDIFVRFDSLVRQPFIK